MVVTGVNIMASWLSLLNILGFTADLRNLFIRKYNNPNQIGRQEFCKPVPLAD